MFYVTESPAQDVRVIAHTPRADDRVVRVCEEKDDAYAALDAHQKHVWQRQALRDAVKALILIGLLLGAAAIVPDLEPPRQEVVA